MTGKEEINIGDQFMCMSNEGLNKIGDIITVYGVSKNSINTNGCDTAWRNRNNFRWGNYKLLRKFSFTEIDFEAKKNLKFKSNGRN